MKTCFALVAGVMATALLAGCGGGNGSGSNDQDNISAKKQILVPGVTPTTNFSFDIADVDSGRGRMYFTDRNNKSVDVVDMTNNTFLKQITDSFAGCDTGPSCAGANNDKSGPDGLVVIPNSNFVYVGDVNSVKIIDANTLAVINTIVVSNSGLRADEGCYDPDHNIFMISSPGESPPFATFIDTTTQQIIAKLLFTDPGTGAAGPASAGLEACAYDHGTQSFIVNNDGTTANPHGEADVIPAAFVMQGTPAAPVVLTLPAITPGNGFSVFPEGNCDPTGLVLGPGTDMAVVCREGTTGARLLLLIMNRVNGSIVASLNAGGGDEIAYDPSSNRYYEAASRWTPNGLAPLNGACAASTPCTPVLFAVDAATHAIISMVESGNNAHSVAVDPVSHQLYMPYSGATAPGGCQTCADFPLGGVLAYSVP